MKEESEALAVLNLWRFTIRRLALDDAGRKIFFMHLASKCSTEKQAVAKMRRRFTAEWWEGVLILAVEECGKLHMIEDQPLYEND